jgi:hypothetical protein
MNTSMTQTIRDKFVVLKPLLDERTRRLWAALEARAGGCGGITRVAEATGLSRSTIRGGLRELDASSTPDDEKKTRTRLRRQGAGRKPLMDHDPRLLEALEATPFNMCRDLATLLPHLKAPRYLAWR